MRYHFVDEIVSLALDGAPRIEVAKRFDPDDDVADGTSVGETDAEVYVEGAPIARARLMCVCVDPSAVDPTPGARA